ncbi:unnamed protein product [Penicillium salamii]|nr:unnamed protein product [Penicillium salamii]
MFFSREGKARRYLCALSSTEYRGPDARGFHATKDIRAHKEEDRLFTAKIRQLEGANHELAFKLDRTQTRLNNAHSKSNQFQKKSRRLRTELKANSLRTSWLKTKLTRVRARVTKAIKALQSHRNQNNSSPARERDRN